MEINAFIRSPVENMVGVLISHGKTEILQGVKRLKEKYNQFNKIFLKSLIKYNIDS